MAILRDDRKNYIINGAFDFFQRAISDTGATSLASNFETYVGPDRFSVVRIGTGGAADEFSRSTAVPNSNFNYSLFAQRDVASASDTLFVTQKIESSNAIELVGSKCSVSFWCFAGTNVDEITLRLDYPNSTDTYPGSTNFALVDLSSQIVNDSWVLYKAENIDVDANAVNGIQMRLQFANTSGVGDVAMNITGIILNEGETASPFKRASKTIGEEFILCQRYYRRDFDRWTGVLDLANRARFDYRLEPNMRATPTMSLIPGSSLVNQMDVIGRSGGVTINSINFALSSAPHVARLTATLASSFNVADLATFNQDVIQADAEL